MISNNIQESIVLACLKAKFNPFKRCCAYISRVRFSLDHENIIMTTMNLLRNVPSMLILLGIMLGIITIQMIQRLTALFRRLFSSMTNSIWRIWRARGILKIDD